MDALLRVLPTYGPWVVLCWVFLDLTLVPIPSEIVLLVAGSLAASGRLGIGRIILAAGLAALLADHLWFSLGRRRGGLALHVLCKLTGRSAQCRDKTLAFFARFGLFSLLVGKFFLGLRAVVPSMAGASRIPYPVFLGADVLGTLVWAVAVSSLGSMFSSQVAQIVALFRGAHAAGLWGAIGIAVGLSMAGHLYLRRPRNCADQ